MSDTGFRTLVRYKKNYTYPGLTEKQLKSEFKEFFLNDESNNLFIDSLTMKELQDLCDCYEIYLAWYPEADLRDLGIAKYIYGSEEYFLFTNTDVIQNPITGEITGINESVSALFQIRNSDTEQRTPKGFFDSTITNKRERLDKDNHPGNLAEKMFKKMFNNEENTDPKAKIMICKSRIRVLMYNYYKATSKEEKIRIQQELKILAAEIEKNYYEEEEIQFAKKIADSEDEIKVFSGSSNNGKKNFDDDGNNDEADREIDIEELKRYDKIQLLNDFIKKKRIEEQEDAIARERREKMIVKETKEENDDEPEL